jgi:hypothetical protein
MIIRIPVYYFLSQSLRPMRSLSTHPEEINTACKCSLEQACWERCDVILKLRSIPVEVGRNKAF